MSKPRIITSFSLDPELYDKLKETLDRERKNLTEFVREAAEAYIKAHGTGNPAVPLQKWMDNPQYVACPSLMELHHHDWNKHPLEDLDEYAVILRQELDRIHSVRYLKKNVKL